MKSSQIFQKALRQLDCGKIAEGEATLRTAIERADADDAEVTRIAARVCLGDLLHELTRDEESIAILETALSLATSDLDGILDFELKRAKELLATLRN